MTVSPALRVGEYKFAQADLTCLKEDGTFSGYASLFEAVDLGRDVLKRGAFQKTLRKTGAGGVRMLFQHDPGQPIGTWEIVREDARGLFVKGRLTLEVERAREVYALIKAGGLNGLSIGFKAVRGRRDPRTGVRNLIEVDLWEISIVTFPMLPEAQIESVKQNVASRRALPTTREFERWLTRDAGLTRKEARTVICSGFKSLGRERDAAAFRPATRKNVLHSIRAASRLLCRP